MAGLNWWNRWTKWLSLNRLSKLQGHYAAIKPELQLSQRKDKQEAEYFCLEFEKYYKRTTQLSNLRLYFYFLLYATLIVNMLKLIPQLSFLIAFIELGSALFGTTVVIVIIFFLNAKINVNLQVMQSSLNHLVTLYQKNPRRDSSVVIAKLSRVI